MASCCPPSRVGLGINGRTSWLINGGDLKKTLTSVLGAHPPRTTSVRSQEFLCALLALARSFRCHWGLEKLFKLRGFYLNKFQQHTPTGVLRKKNYVCWGGNMYYKENYHKDVLYVYSQKSWGKLKWFKFDCQLLQLAEVYVAHVGGGIEKNHGRWLKKMVKIWLPIFEEDMVSNKVGELIKPSCIIWKISKISMCFPNFFYKTQR